MSVSNRLGIGYPEASCPAGSPDVLDATLPDGLQWRHLDTVSSTNTMLLAETSSVSQLLSANRQTQGRGRRRQQWFDEGDSALFSLSVCLAQQLDYSAWPVQVAITLAETLNALIQQTTKKPVTKQMAKEGSEVLPTAPFVVKVKWPNDLYIPCCGDEAMNWGKCGGILVESTIGKHSKIVTGVGLNLSPVKQRLTADYSIAYIQLPIAKTTLIRLLGKQLYLAWQAFVKNPVVSPERFQKLDWLLGKSLVATTSATNAEAANNLSTLTGVGSGINRHGRLLVDSEEATVVLSHLHRIRLSDLNDSN